MLVDLEINKRSPLLACLSVQTLNGASKLPQGKPLHPPPINQQQQQAQTQQMQGSSSSVGGGGGLASSLHGFSASSARSFGLQAEPHKALFTKAAVINNNNNKTIVLRVAMTSPRVRTVVEDALLSVRGVVSFTFDCEANRFTVRARKDVEAEMLFDAILDSDDSIDICQVIKTTDGKVRELFISLH